MDRLDYSSFLLSCSPPQFDSSLLNCLNIRALSSPLNNRKNDVAERECLDEENNTNHDVIDNFDEDIDLDDTINISFNPSLERESTEHRDERIKVWESNYDSRNSENGLALRKVNFADESGLNLLELFEDERSSETTLDCSSSESLQNCFYDLNFKLPLPEREFLSKVTSQNICLDKISISNDSIYGVVCISCHEEEGSKVIVRCTHDDWKSFSDHEAIYVGKRFLPPTTETDFEMFEFEVLLKETSMCGKMIFALMMKTKDGHEFWDNNDNQNYILTLK